MAKYNGKLLYKISEARRKFLASIMLVGFSKEKIILPSVEEWYGLNLLDRDDELPENKGLE